MNENLTLIWHSLFDKCTVFTCVAHLYMPRKQANICQAPLRILYDLSSNVFMWPAKGGRFYF